MTNSRAEVEAARERLVSVEELTEELRWHVHFDDDDEQVPCNICGSDDVPCIVERLALDWRNAHAHIEVLEAALRDCRHWIRDELGWPKPDWPLPDGEDLLAAIDALLPEARDE